MYRPKVKSEYQMSLIDQPLILISQIQRSGGSMLAQLFDGHPQVFAHPFEMHIGHPNKWDWRDFDVSSKPEQWFASLFEEKVMKFITEGYCKPGANKYAASEKFPFNFDPAKQKQVFLELVSEYPNITQRQIYNCYFTSFFNAWSDYQSTGKEKFVSGFTPRVNMQRESSKKYFRDYPDGKLISSFRDPFSWYTSAIKHNNSHKNIDFALDEWMQSVTATIELKKQFPHQVCIVQFSDLTNDSENVMRKVARFIGIDYDEILVSPTYLRHPVRPNSSYNVDSYGINANMAKRGEQLPDEIRQYILKKTSALIDSTQQYLLT